MKLFLKKLANTNLGIFLRNNFNFKNVLHNQFKNFEPISVSDAFLWRTDNNFKTKFKYSDILNIFYKIKNSNIEIHIYNKKNILIKVEKFKNINMSNEFEISSNYLDNLQDYGVFYIFHFSTSKIEKENIISNRCYLGYSQNNSLYSFVHGNTYARYTSIISNEKIDTNIVNTTFFKNQKYTIQKYFKGFGKNELFFANPTSKKIKFNLENKDHTLEAGCTKKIITSQPILTIKSNCLFLRPTIFSYKNNYFDVHHS